MNYFIIPNRYPVTGQSFVSEHILSIFHPDSVIRTSSNLVSTCFDFCKAYVGRADLVYITLSRSRVGSIRDYIILGILRPRRVIAHIHGKGFINANLVLRLNLKRSTDIIVLTNDSVKELNRSVGLKNQSIHVIGNPVFDSSLLRINPHPRKEKITLYYFSNLMITKGYMDFIELAKEFKSSYIFEVAGTNIEGLPIEGDFFYYGRLDKKAKAEYLYRNHVHLFLSTYVEEFYPISLIESICAGNLCIVLKHNGLENVFRDCGIVWVNSRDEVFDLLSDSAFLNKLYFEHCAFFAKNHSIIWEKFSLKLFNDKILTVFKNANSTRIKE